MEALGRLINVVPTGDAAWVSLKHATAVTFVCVGANAETFTLQQATAAAGTGAANLAVIDHYYYSSAAVGATAWAKATQAAGAVVTTTTAQPVAVIHVSANSLADGFTHVSVASSSTGTVVAILHDLAIQRSPEYLPLPVSNT